MAFLPNLLAERLQSRTCGAVSSSYAPALHFKGSDGFYYWVETSSAQARIYRETALIRVVNVVASTTYQGWNQNVGRIGDRVYIPRFASPWKAYLDTVEVTENGLTSTLICELPQTPECTTEHSYMKFSVFSEPETGKVYFSAWGLHQEDASFSPIDINRYLREVWELSPLGVKDHRLFTSDSDINGTGRTDISANGSNLYWHFHEGTTEKYGSLVAADTDGSFTQIATWSTTPPGPGQGVFNSIGPYGLHFRISDLILRNYDESDSWDLGDYIDTFFIWSVVDKVDSTDTYHILTRDASEIIHYLYLEPGGTVTELSSKSGGTANSLVSMRATWDGSKIGTKDGPIILGDRTDQVFALYPEWREVL